MTTSTKNRVPVNLQKIIHQGRRAMLPPPEMTVVEWAEKYRRLPSGRYHVDRSPHAKEIMIAISDPFVEEISWMGSAQIAKTTVLENTIGRKIHIDPEDILFMAPTIDVVKRFSKQKLEPMIEDTPELRVRIAKKKSRDSDNTTLYKRFIGGFIIFVGANSPHGLRQMSIPMVISDDIDSIEIGSTKEGDPVIRAEKRSLTFTYRRKRIRTSTPTRKGSSRINAFFEQGTMERYYVQCLHCQTKQILKFEQIIWEQDKDVFGKILKEYPETAKIACEKCGTLLSESERYAMLLKGKWKADHPERPKHRSFHINEISSTLSTLENVVREYITSKDDREKMETFTNLVLGLPYEADETEEIPEAELVKRLEDYLTLNRPYIPNEVLLITIGVDCQKNRIEFEVNGWGIGEENWTLYYGMFPGTLEDNKVKKQLDTLRHREWEREDGLKIRSITTFIDSGYQSPSKPVYEYCRTRERERVFAIKGIGGYGKKLLYNISRVYQKTTSLITIGTNEAKMIIYSRLKLTCEKPVGASGPKIIHFTKEFCDSDYFAMLTAEKAITKTTGLVEYIVYEKKKHGIRNEALDCKVYAYAAMARMLINFEKLKINLDKKLKDGKENKTTEPELEIQTKNKEIIKKPNLPDATRRVKAGRNKQPRTRKRNSVTNW